MDKNPIRDLIKRIVQSFGYKIARIQPGEDLEWAEVVRLNDEVGSVRVIFDIGAHEGHTLVKLSKSFPEAQVYSFEPGAEAFAKLREVAQNLPFARKPLLFPFAMGDQPGQGRIHLNKLSWNNSLLSSAPENSTGINAIDYETRATQEISISTLDLFCHEHDIPKIDLLKIDTQGFDLKVLKGASALLAERKVRWIEVELNCIQFYEEQAYMKEVVRYLEDHGYSLFNLCDSNRSKTGRLLWLDGLFRLDPTAP